VVIHGANRPNGIYSFLDDKQSYSVEAKSNSIKIVFDRMCHVVGLNGASEKLAE
jgi:hypothetical protein